MTPKLIIALDFDNQNQVWNLVEQLDPEKCALKVGLELYTRFGASLVKQLIARKFKVFLDLKFHDIPNTVAKAAKVCADLGVWMFNVHASGGRTMMQATVKALESYGADKPLLIAVTVLTSFSNEDLLPLGISYSVEHQVTALSLLAKESGLKGVVCSAHEVQAIKNQCCSDFITVTPGIRLKEDKPDDQWRIMTPDKAVALGSDFLVVGRPITQAQNPQQVISDILSLMS